MKGKGGVPSTYSDETADKICAELAIGRSLRSICAEEGMPHMVTVFRWLREHETFRSQYARAREAQADAIFDEALDIADNATNDWMARTGNDDSEAWRVNGENIQRSKLRVDTRKWMAGKLAPKKYGDKQVLEHSGPDGGAVRVDVSDRDRAKAVAELIARVKGE